MKTNQLTFRVIEMNPYSTQFLYFCMFSHTYKIALSFGVFIKCVSNFQLKNVVKLNLPTRSISGEPNNSFSEF